MNWKPLALALSTLFVLTFAITPSWAQSQQSGTAGKFGFDESGFITGMGTGSTSEGNYSPILLIWHLSSDLKRYAAPLRDHKGTLSFFLEPQVNPAFSPKTDIEAGVGVGLKYAYPLTDRVSPYIMGSVGPHFFTLKDEDQASGFVFANTIGAGLYIYLDKKSAINLGYRYRHLSNAGIKSPNGGINTQFGVIGYSVFF